MTTALSKSPRGADSASRLEAAVLRDLALLSAAPAEAGKAPPWHRGSEFGPGPRVPHSPGVRLLWMARLDFVFLAGRITRATRAIGRKLLRLLGPDGQLDPSQAFLANDPEVRCCDRTVRRAILALRDNGLLSWRRRLKPSPDGWRAEQTSNAYELLVPAEWTRPLPQPERVRVRRRFGGQCASCLARARPASPPPSSTNTRDAQLALMEQAYPDWQNRVREAQAKRSRGASLPGCD